jgi:hypothetical protein
MASAFSELFQYGFEHFGEIRMKFHVLACRRMDEAQSARVEQLTADRDAKKHAYDTLFADYENWMDENGKRWNDKTHPDYPKHDELDSARDEYFRASNALSDFEEKEWN